MKKKKTTIYTEQKKTIQTLSYTIIPLLYNDRPVELLCSALYWARLPEKIDAVFPFSRECTSDLCTDYTQFDPKQRRKK